ncbi:UNVERIFIED_CONTAM: Flavonol synthase/flavanone 3-hydroxylase [Sesamum indicum]
MEVQRVQSVASLSKNTDTIPSEFIKSENEQPAATTLHGVVLEVPVIDIGLTDDSNEKMIVELISEASRDWGIFQVVNHGILDQTISNLQRVGQEFFELPRAERELIAKTPESGIEGFHPAERGGGQEGLGGSFVSQDMATCCCQLQGLAQESTFLHVSGCFSTKVFFLKDLRIVDKVAVTRARAGRARTEGGYGGKDTIFLMKINYYPPCPQPDLALGVTILVAHTDMSEVTIVTSVEFFT